MRMDGYGRSATETEIVRQLSLADIGTVPEADQFAVANRVLEQMHAGEHIKSFDLFISQKGTARVMKIGWSRMLNFPSQTMSVSVVNLTRQNLEILEVMSS